MPEDLLSVLTDDEILQLAGGLRGAATPRFPFKTLEELLTSKDGFGLTSATPLQRAICRAIEGRALLELWDYEAVRRSFNQVQPQPTMPSEVVIVAGVRTAKSMLAAAKAIWAAQTCDLTMLQGGEIPRYSIISLEKDNARVVMAHLLGALAKPAMVPFHVGGKDGGKWTRIIEETGADDIVGSVFLWHPSGRPVEVRVVAGKRAGGSLVSRWSIGCALDEAPRMVGASEGVVNYDDARNAVRTRLLPGAQLFSLGSPWQPYGPIYDMVQSEWGNPHPGRVVIKARGPDMNPVWWTPERCEEIRNDPKNKFSYQTDVLAEFADEEETLFPQEILKRAVREGCAPLDYDKSHDYVAAMDPATRGNAWTLVIADRTGNRKRVVAATQWIGSAVEPLSPKAVLADARELLSKYHLTACYTDQWAADAIKDLATDMGLDLMIENPANDEKVNWYLSLAASMTLGNIELPDNLDLVKDLKLVRRKPTTRGVSISLPVTPDGRHCDYAPALVLALHQWLDEERELPPKPGDTHYWKYAAAQLEEADVADFEKKQRTPWWVGEDGDDNSVETFDEEVPLRLGAHL